MTYLTPKELATRWKMHPTSLGNWRVKGKGPRYIKLGWRVLYLLADVEAYEKRRRTRRTARKAT